MNIKELILKNPELPIVFYNTKEITTCFSELAVYAEIKPLIMYDGRWMDEDEYSEKLWDDLCDMEECANLSDSDIEKMVGQKVSETNFTNVIVGWI